MYLLSDLFQKNEIQALIIFNSEVNIITPIYAV